MISAQTLRRALGMAAALLLVLGVAASGRAQGLFYAEETKDGRIYVFNIKDNGNGSSSRARPARAITRLGVGPNGETVVRGQRDGARAVLLQARDLRRKWSGRKIPPRRIEWRDGKTRFTLGDNFYLEMSNRVQPRYTYEMPDDTRAAPGDGQPGRRQGQLPHPPRQVQARGLVLQARARIRAAAQLAGREQHAAEPVPGGREHRLGPLQGQEGLPVQVRADQGALRTPAAHLVRGSAVRRSRHPGRVASATRARRASPSGARSATTSSTGASWSRTETAAPRSANDNAKLL